MIEGLRTIKGKSDGPKVVIIASIHGNEPAGMAAYALLKRYFIDEGNELVKGEIRLLKGNIKAREKGVRFLKYDLNRMFFDEYPQGIDQNSYEYQRAQEIKKTIEGANYILDLHSTTSESEPFSILADRHANYSDAIMNIPVAFTSDGWGSFLKGPLMNWVIPRGMEYVAVECGMNDTKSADETARKVAMAFLNSLGMSNFNIQFDRPKKHLKLLDCISVEDYKSYYYPEGHFASFDKLEANQLIAKDAKREYRAPNMDNLVIIMPGSEESIRQGVNKDAYFLGQFVDL